MDNLIGTFPGVSTWHMLQAKYTDYRMYGRYLQLLASQLRPIPNINRMIWMQQLPVHERFGDTNAVNTAIHARKVDQYNFVAYQVLQSVVGIYIYI